jgi:hypothetical protein
MLDGDKRADDAKRNLAMTQANQTLTNACQAYSF